MYLLRLDDASEHWNKQNWVRMHELLQKYSIHPIVAIIPHNEDQNLLKYPEDEEFWDLIRLWINEGWTPALHGYNHVLSSPHGGINPVNQRSEFAGVDIDEQRKKIKRGCRLLYSQGIIPEIFVAPAHTFDVNTLRVLREETPIRVISDTIASDVYIEDGFTYIPQQSGNVRKIPLPLVTFCYHPNFMSGTDFAVLEKYIARYQQVFTSISQLNIGKRELTSFDRTLNKAYFMMRKFKSVK